MRRNQKVRNCIGQLQTEQGDSTRTDKELAEELGKFFKSVFVEEGNGNLLEFDNRLPEENHLHEASFTEHDVLIKTEET